MLRQKTMALALAKAQARQLLQGNRSRPNVSKCDLSRARDQIDQKLVRLTNE